MNLEDKVLRAMLCMTRQCWEQGIAAQALLEKKEEELLELFVDDMLLRQSSDGRLCNVENTPAVTDCSFCIPAVWEIGKRTGNQRALKACGENREFFLEKAERTPDGVLYHMAGSSDIWADSAAFLPYTLALLGKPEEGTAQMYGICDRLYRKEKGLYSHKWNEEKQGFIRDALWGIGNGWILTGLLRLYLEVREEKLLSMFGQLLAAMVDCLDETYLLHDVLDEKDSFYETESSEMLAYAIYRGVREKIVDAALVKTADCIEQAVRKKVNDRGQVLDASSSPDFVRPGTSVECQAHFLMMEEAKRSLK